MEYLHTATSMGTELLIQLLLVHRDPKKKNVQHTYLTRRQH